MGVMLVPVYFFVIIAAVLALLLAALLALRNVNLPYGSENMRSISLAIQEGAIAFLRREYTYLLVFGTMVFVVLLVTQGLGWKTAIAFVVGGLCSAGAGYLGMRIATKSNVRTTHAATISMPAALRVAFSAGAVTGLSVVGLGVLGITILFLLFTHGGKVAFFDDALRQYILGFSLGASSIALFARVGGGIFTKAADVGADLVGKVEAGIPEDDPRNPAVIADNVGDNVGDVAGMGADLFESYVGSIISAMLLGYIAYRSEVVAVFPLAIAAVGIVSSIIGVIYTLFFTAKNPQSALRNGTFIAGAIMIGGAAWLTFATKAVPNGVLWAIIAGLVAGTIIGLITEYFTSATFKPTQALSGTATTGPATFVLGGLGLGMYSAMPAMLTIVAAIYLAYAFSGGFTEPTKGLFGIAMAAVGMLSTLGVTLAVDAYGPVADNAGGIAEMSELPPEVRGITDQLDSVGNTTAAIGKGFAIGSAALTALAFFAAYTGKAHITRLDLSEPVVIVGLFIGAMLPFLFCSLSLRAVELAAHDMIEEVRRQFREIPGLLEGKAKGNHARCVDIATKGALNKMIAPGLLAVLSPILVGIVFKLLKIWLYPQSSSPGGAEAVGGLLAGALASGVMLALFMANSGGAWDNAKKYIEGGRHGGKGSEAHMAAVVGDTVGDPFKDTAGPSLNILLKLMSIVALIFVVWFA
jgi:K(+)-stimulated pyrophosphate-energized sodium pump